MLIVAVFRKYHRVCCTAIACSGAGLEQYFKSVETVKAKSGQVLSIIYIIDLIAC
jgi:hypothetical protein